MSENFRCFFILGVFIALLLSFWVFGRFTVDDAFISWRYGKNLVDFGIWNYNPSTFDMTQAYTNPIYAALSVIPNYFTIDVVLFFKLFSIFYLSLFFLYFYRKTKSTFMLLVAYASPAFIIHSFGGLETGLYVLALSVLFISLYENKVVQSAIITLLLLLVRPEAWLFVIATPMYFLLRNTLDSKDFNTIFKELLTPVNYAKNIKVFISLGLILILFLTVYLVLHKFHFGYALPNTFYVKSGRLISLEFIVAAFFLAFPLCLLLINKKVTIWVVFLGYFLITGFQYAISDLQMNYAERFLFHIVMPVYFILVYLASNKEFPVFSLMKEASEYECKIKPQLYINTMACLILFLFSFKTINGLPHMASYYPRALDSHAELGRALNSLKNQNKIESFSLGDAGMVAYHSQLNALDNVGLGSSLVAHNPFNKELIDTYSPDLVIFYSSPDEIKINVYNQKQLKNWADYRDYSLICEIYWQTDYTLAIYGSQSYPELLSVCLNSKRKNNAPNREYLKFILQKSPFSYWHE